jgi:hypothetical protein
VALPPTSQAALDRVSLLLDRAELFPFTAEHRATLVAEAGVYATIAQLLRDEEIRAAQIEAQLAPEPSPADAKAERAAAAAAKRAKRAAELERERAAEMLAIDAEVAP